MLTFNYYIRSNIIYLKLILVAFFFGGTFVAGRIIAPVVPPCTAAFIRFLIASFFLIVFSWQKYRRFPAINLQQIGLLVILGLSGMAVYNYLFFSGLEIISASRASIIIALNPVGVALFSRILFKEEFNYFKTAGLIMALLGAVTVITHGRLLTVFAGGIGRGELFILGCVASWIVFTLAGKVLMAKMPPLLVVTYASIAGTILLIGPALKEREILQFVNYPLDVWTGFFVLGFLATALAFTWFYEGVDDIGPSRAGVFLSFVPVFATILAVLILNETIDKAFLIGAVLVMSGVYFTNRKKANRDIAYPDINCCNIGNKKNFTRNN